MPSAMSVSFARVSALLSVAFAQGTITLTSGWELYAGENTADLSATMGTYGNVGSVAVVQQSSCNSGSYCLKATESPISGDPDIYLAWVSNLQSGDSVTASYWARGVGTDAQSKIFAHWTSSGDDYESYDSSASGSVDYAGAGGTWSKTSATWYLEEGGSLLIKARMYCTEEDDTIYIDDLSITVTSSTAQVATAPSYVSDFDDPDRTWPIGTYTSRSAELEVTLANDCRTSTACFKVTEGPFDGTPAVFVASAYDLQPYDQVYAHVWIKGTSGSASKGQIWASNFVGDEPSDHDDGHSDGGPSTYAGEGGIWEMSEYSWSVGHGHTGLNVEVRVYSDSYAADPSIYIDDIFVSTNSTTAWVQVAPVAAPSPPSLSSRIKWGVKAVVAATAAKALLTRLSEHGCGDGLCEEDCSWSSDNDCDDGGPGSDYSLCAFGTDCHDCGCRTPFPPSPPLPPPPPPLELGDEICLETCYHSSDTDCDDGGEGAEYTLCEMGTDCIDCGPRQAHPPPPPAPSTPPIAPSPPNPPPLELGDEICLETCYHSSDTDCDDGGEGAEYSICEMGTDCIDCGPRYAHPPPPTPPFNGCFNDCYLAFDGDCDDGGPGGEYTICDLGSDCFDCGPREELAA